MKDKLKNEMMNSSFEEIKPQKYERERLDVSTPDLQNYDLPQEVKELIDKELSPIQTLSMNDIPANKITQFLYRILIQHKDKFTTIEKIKFIEEFHKKQVDRFERLVDNY